MESSTVLGLMSGTSLDGLDLALCRFSLDSGAWTFEILAAKTSPYPATLAERLSKAHRLPSHLLQQLDLDLGRFFAEEVIEFTSPIPDKPGLLSSHGHTVFHQPERGITLQIGNGRLLADLTGKEVVNDFRWKDVSLGGQGAPLVPVGDMHLFKAYEFCLNLGGISNISFDENGKRIAFDCTPFNIVLNHWSNMLGKAYDDKGDLARKGKLIKGLLDAWNTLPFYKKAAPRSLGREWVEANFLSGELEKDHAIEDLLHTFVEHVSIQIAEIINRTGMDKSRKILVTGGGAYNSYAIGRLGSMVNASVVLPEKQIIEYKEALIFAFLGLLRKKNEINALASVTGANEDSSGGEIYLPE